MALLNFLSKFTLLAFNRCCFSTRKVDRMKIKLNIKSPTAIEDKCIESEIESTVKDVKHQIEQEWPSNPTPKDQRLVYAGKLLEDNSILKDVLRMEDARDENDAFTIHLVCRITTPPPQPNLSQKDSVLRKRTNVENGEQTTVNNFFLSVKVKI